MDNEKGEVSDMSKNRQQRRALRGETVPVPSIVATDPVALGPTVTIDPVIDFDRLSMVAPNGCDDCSVEPFEHHRYPHRPGQRVDFDADPGPDDTQVLPTVGWEPTPAPEFPGIEEEGTPFFDALAGSPEFAHLWAEGAHWDTEALAEPEPWGLVERLPLPIEGLIEDLKAGMDPAVAWTIEESVGAQAMLSRTWEQIELEESQAYDELEEVRYAGDGAAEDGPAGDAEGADPGGGDQVANRGDDDPALPAAG